MVVTDNLGDMLIRIKNAYMVGKKSCSMFFSKEKEHALSVLAQNDFVAGYRTEGEDNKKTLIVELHTTPISKYFSVKRISKPGRRIYIKTKDIYKVKGGRGMLLLSTSQGIMSGKDAREKKLGGELLAEISH